MLSTRNKVKPDFNMSSMTDLIFLLLIFFILTSNTVTTNALNLNLPSANGQVVTDKNINVSINHDGEYFINGTQVYGAELQDKLGAMLKDNPNETVILNADKTIPLDYVVKVMAIIKDMNAKMVLATDPIQ